MALHPSTNMPVLQQITLALKLAVRNLRNGAQGFRVFLGCIALGVTAIVGVGSLANALSDGLEGQGRLLLGGDVSVSRIHRPATEAELAYLTSKGSVSSLMTVRAMALSPDATSLVEVKAVDDRYPALGEIILEPALPLATALASDGDVYGAVGDPTLFARLGLEPGALITVGKARFRLMASITAEPDKLAGGVTYGPRLMMSQAGLIATGLVQPGSLVRWTYRLQLPEGANSDRAISDLEAALPKQLPDSGFEFRSRLNASPQLTRNIERFTQYLTIVGLTALVVGGVGVANAVSAYVERRRSTLAILKAVGANGTRVFLIAGAEVLLLAALGIVIGLVLGAALPFGVASLAASALPITLDPHLYPEQIATGALYGFLTTLAFSLLPLGRVHDIPVAALFRDEVAPNRTFPRKRYLVGAFSSALLLAASIITLSYDSRIASFAVGGTLAAFLILRLVAVGIMAGVKRLPPVRRTEWRLALANIHRPGALTPSLIVSLGLGVTLLVTIGLVDVNIQRLLGRSLPEKAPSFFFVDVPKSDIADFREFLAQSAPEGKIGDVPMMRGRVLRVKNVAAEDVKVAEQSAWVLDGDRGITFADTLPEGSALTAGEWWPQNYGGPPLVSLEEGIATGLDLKLGDKITVGVLGRSIEATIANIRKVEWRSMGINFVMVFSPNTFAGAPNTHLMSLTLPKLSNVSTETALLLASARAFPSITAVRVKEALEAVNDLVGKLALAIRGASGVTLLASVLVLAGALGSGQRARIYDSVILKALGATRGRLLNSLLFEYGLLGLFAALFGVIAGTGASYLVVRNIMNFEYAFDAGVALLVAVTAIIATIIIGLIGTWTVLGQKPARHLRAQ